MKSAEVAHRLVKAMKQMELPQERAREMRALFMAHSFAYHIRLSTEKSLDDIHTEHLPAFKAVLNGVNEFLPVDTSLSLSYFRQLLRARMDVLMNFANSELILAVTEAQVEHGHFSPEVAAGLKAILKGPIFSTTQHMVRGVIETYYAAAAE